MQKLVRLLFVAVAIAVAGFLAYRGCTAGGTKTPVEPAPTPAPDDPNGAPWQPLEDGKTKSAPKDPAPKPPVEPPAPIADEPPTGTPVKAGASVSLVVPYKTGAKSRYRVSEAGKLEDRASQALQWQQWIWTVATEVVQGDGSGAARIKVTPESFRFQTSVPGLRVDFDSTKPDKTILDDERFVRDLKPNMAICGMPYEVKVAATGAIVGVEGVEPIRRKFLDVVDQFNARAVAGAMDAPSADSLMERWTECLFPPVVGGTLSAGQTRPASFRTTYFERWAAQSPGTATVTHDDPGAFRMEFKGKTDVEELPIEAKNPLARSIEKTRVISSADCYRAWWRFDREKGRMAGSDVKAKYCFVWTRPIVGAAEGEPQWDPHYIDVERWIRVELLPE